MPKDTKNFEDSITDKLLPGKVLHYVSSLVAAVTPGDTGAIAHTKYFMYCSAGTLIKNPTSRIEPGRNE